MARGLDREKRERTPSLRRWSESVCQVLNTSSHAHKNKACAGQTNQNGDSTLLQKAYAESPAACYAACVGETALYCRQEVDGAHGLQGAAEDAGVSVVTQRQMSGSTQRAHRAGQRGSGVRWLL